MSDPLDEQILNRDFVAIATSKYDDTLRLRQLPGVMGELAMLRKWLCHTTPEPRRFDQKFKGLARNPTRKQVLEAGGEFRTAWNHSDAVVAFVTGHGHFKDGRHWVVLKATDLQSPTSTAVATADIMGWFAESEADHMLVIFDMCHAGSAAADIIRIDRDFKDTWIVLASATKNQTATEGALTSAIAGFLQDAMANNRLNHGPYFRIDEFIEGVQSRLPPGQNLSQLHDYIPRRQVFSPCLPNPRYRPDEELGLSEPLRDLAIRPEDLASHWDPRGRGVAQEEDPGWLFTGRVRLMRRLIDFVKGPPGTIVLTGGAGCGKSAALARLVTLADEGFVAAHARQVETIPDTLRPPIGSIDAAVLAVGKHPQDVLGQICDALRVPVAGGSLAELREAWWGWLRSAGRPVTIVVDALDEAPYPRTVLTEVLATLNPVNTKPLIRLIVGVRSLGAGEDPFALASTATKVLNAVRIRADSAPYWSTSDVIAYTNDILTTTKDSPYRQARTGLVNRIASVIGRKAATSYLFAHLAASSLASRTDVIKPDNPVWLAALDQNIVGIFRDDLHATLKDPIHRERAVQLLRAVAFARGTGIPWSKVWPTMTNAVANHPEYSYGDQDIEQLLASRLAGYLVTDQEDDTRIYRLFHDSLRNTLRDSWQELLIEATG